MRTPDWGDSRSWRGKKRSIKEREREREREREKEREKNGEKIYGVCVSVSDHSSIKHET